MMALFKRDLALSVRLGGAAPLALGFFVLVALIVSFSLGPEPDLLQAVGPGMIWTAALLSVLLTLDRLFGADAEDGSLAGLATLGPALEMVVLVKVLAHIVGTIVPLCVAAPIVALMFNLPPDNIPMLVASLALGGPALSLIGAIGAALTVGVRRGGLVLSIIVLPLYVPVLIFGAAAASNGVDAMAGLAILLLALVAALVLAPFAAAAALRLQLG